MSNRQVKILKSLAMLAFLLPICIIGLCIFIVVFSMTVDAVTGIDIIRNYIRPLFGN